MFRYFVKFPPNEDCVKFPPNEDCNPGDKFSTSQLIIQAISASKNKQLSSSDIHNLITETHPEQKKSKIDISRALSSNRYHFDKKKPSLLCGLGADLS